MSNLLQFEKNIEEACVSFLNNNELKASRSREVQDLSINNIQISLDYTGAIETTRQVRKGYHEYDLHQGTLTIIINTYRVDKDEHHTRLGKVRNLMLNGYNGFNAEHYTIFDIMPDATQTAEDTENNLDQSELSYLLKWRVDYSKL